MKKVYFLSVLVLLLSCSKNSSHVESDSLVGKWLLTANYYGNIPKGKWTKPIEKTVYEFTSGDSLILTAESRLPMKVALEYLSDSTFRVKGETLSHYYKVEGNRLTLKHPCDEGCIWKFIRVGS